MLSQSLFSVFEISHKIEIHPVNIVNYRSQNGSIFLGQVIHKKAIKIYLPSISLN